MKLRRMPLWGLLLLATMAINAQSPCENARKNPSKIYWEDCGREIFTHKPVRPLPPTSIVPGSGFGLGVAYYNEFNSDAWQRNVTLSGAVTLRKFYEVEAVPNSRIKPGAKTIPRGIASPSALTSSIGICRRWRISV